MHNTTFIPHTSSTQPPSATTTRVSTAYCPSTTKTALKRLSSSESATSIAHKPPGKTTGTSTGARTRTGAGTRTIISTTTTATTIAKTTVRTATSSSSTSSRAPLRRRDQNASPVIIPPPKETGTGNMPFDTSSPPPTNPQPNANRPQMPSLSASAARVINRNPLTPKIASKTAQQPPTLATGPASRRQHHPTSINTAREPPSSRSTYLDESPSFSSHLNSSVTPRSGSRQNRVESANSTPNGTPNPERSEAWDTRSSFGLPSPRLEGEAMRRSVVSFGTASPDLGGYGRQESSQHLESKFFHASDVKPSRPTSSKNAQTKGPTFFYANGNTVETKASQPTTFAPTLSHPQDNIASKFMYANGTPESRSSPTPPISRSSGSTTSAAPRGLTSRPTTNPPVSSHPHSQRPASPAKQPPQPLQGQSKTTSLPGSGRSQALSTPQLGPSPPGLRRSSTGTSRPGGHSRKGSLIKGDQYSSAPKLTSSQVSPEISPPITVPATPAPLTLASIIQAAEDFAESEEPASPDEPRSGLQSPKSVPSADPVNELVANARRERKVQDLQITNASLEAINRTLERQLRKQTAELRRYQRLSRSGRFSASPTTIVSRGQSEGVSEQGAGIMDLSDLSENSEAGEQEDEKEEKEAEEEESLESDSASESLSPSVVAERDAKHRKRDEERLQVDLSKHQQLLVDSQRINQSIRRCLDWTEVLINEGKKALEYHVRISDVQLGGRVLDPLDDEEEEHPPTEDSFPDDTIALDEKLLDDRVSLASWSMERQDRDSGIELPVDGG